MGGKWALTASHVAVCYLIRTQPWESFSMLKPIRAALVAYLLFDANVVIAQEAPSRARTAAQAEVHRPLGLLVDACYKAADSDREAMTLEVQPLTALRLTGQDMIARFGAYRSVRAR